MYLPIMIWKKIVHLNTIIIYKYIVHIINYDNEIGYYEICIYSIDTQSYFSPFYPEVC